MCSFVIGGNGSREIAFCKVSSFVSLSSTMAGMMFVLVSVFREIIVKFSI